jgi:hypothetical protein
VPLIEVIEQLTTRICAFDRKTEQRAEVRYPTRRAQASLPSRRADGAGMHRAHLKNSPRMRMEAPSTTFAPLSIARLTDTTEAVLVATSAG